VPASYFLPQAAANSTGLLNSESPSQVARIQKYAAQIKALETRLMGNGIIPMTEQSQIHAEIRRLKKEMEDLEKRTR
jgi:hypothetical protein